MAWPGLQAEAAGLWLAWPHPRACDAGNFVWQERSCSTAAGALELALHPHAPLTAVHPRDDIGHRPAHRRPRRRRTAGRCPLRQPAHLRWASTPAILTARDRMPGPAHDRARTFHPRGWDFLLSPPCAHGSTLETCRSSHCVWDSGQLL